MRVWTPERVETLLQHLAAKQSHNQIAKLMGTTRGSINGMMKVLGLRTPRIKNSPEERERLRQAKLQRRYAKLRLKRKQGAVATKRIRVDGGARVLDVAVKPLPAPRSVPVEPRHLSLLDLQPTDCRWPYGDGPFTFCGCAKMIGSSYCEAHAALSQGQRQFTPVEVTQLRRAYREGMRAEAVS